MALNNKIKTEVIIVGGGPAGSTCAWQLRKQGINCIILDKEVFPRTKLCAGWITPHVLKLLKVDPDKSPFPMLSLPRLVFHAKKLRLAKKTQQYSIRRIEFDNWLIQRAKVPVYYHNVQKITKQDDNYIVDNKYQANYLIGAGGTYCPISSNFFAEDNPKDPSSLIIGIEQEFKYEATEKDCHLWFFDHKISGYSWYLPKPNGYINVGIGSRAKNLKQQGMTITEHWDLFTKKLEELGYVKNHTYVNKGHTYYLRNNNPVTYKDNIYLIGDSAGLASTDLGEGIGPAIESGILAAKAIKNGTKYSISKIKKRSLPSIFNPFN